MAFPRTPLTPLAEPLPTLRGLIPLHTARGSFFRLEDIERWLLINRSLFKTRKTDLLLRVSEAGPLAQVLDSLEARDIALSLRVGGACWPEHVAALLPRLHDLCVEAGPETSAEFLAAWRDAAEQHGKTVRVYCCGPWTAAQAAGMRELLREEAPVRQVTAALEPFGERLVQVAPRQDAECSLRSLAEILQAAQEAGADVSVFGVPQNYLPEALRLGHLPWARGYSDLAWYVPESLELALRLYRSGRARAATALYALAAQSTQRLSLLDNFVLRILLHRITPVQNSLAALHRLTRFGGWLRSVARPRRWPAQSDEPQRKRLDDYERALWQRAYPKLPYAVTPAAPLPERARWVDDIDGERLRPFYDAALVEEAQRRLRQEIPTREVSPESYGASNAHTIVLPGGHRWFSLANVEKISEPLGMLDAPYTVSYMLGGGSAEYAGFAFGRGVRVLAPTTRLDHQFALHVAADGQYVFLRDEMPVQPVEFTGHYTLPRRIPTRGVPLISLWNIDHDVITSRVLVWEGAPPPPIAPPAVPPVFSVVIVCTRYARRLQAALRCLAAAEGLEPHELEVLIAYVPGIDPTDDVIDSIQLAHPHLRILRMPFGPRDAKSKGMLINEAVNVALGEWVVIMDADILVPPPLFARIRAEAGEHPLVAPDGRKMLDRETTARILLGEVDPAREWQALLQGPGEWRRREADDVPIGFFQCVRGHCWKYARYEEVGSFEGADWRFAHVIREVFGKEKWLDGLPVLHLDHGGSQWFGTTKQY